MSYPAEVFYEISRHITNPRDHQALACTCLGMYLASIQIGSLGNLTKTKHFGSYFGNIRLSDVQTKTLNYIYSRLDKAIANCYFVLPMSSGKTLISLIYALDRVKATGRPALIAVPTKCVSTYRTDVNKFFPDENIHIGEGYCKRPAVYIIDRSTNRNSLNLVENNFCCILIDEVHTGDASRDNIYDQVLRTDNDVQLVCFTASSKIPRFNKANMTCVYSTSFGMILFKVYIPKVEIEEHLADIHFYPCLLEDGSYYSAECSEVTKEICSEFDFPSKEFGKSMELLIEVLLNVHKRFIVMVTGKQCIDVCSMLDEAGFDVAICDKQDKLEDIDSQVVILDVNKFSESINIIAFSHLFLFNYMGSNQRARQCVGRLQRTTNTTREIHVWITSISSSLVFSVLPPKAMVDEYMLVMGKRSGYGIGVSKANAQFFVPGMSLAEITVISHKIVFPERSCKWLVNKGYTVYTPLRAIRISRGNEPSYSVNKGCLLSEMEPIVVGYRSGNEVVKIKHEIEFDFDLELLDEMDINPNCKGNYSVSQLKTYCKKYGLMFGGNKQQLIERLLEFASSIM